MRTFLSILCLLIGSQSFASTKQVSQEFKVGKDAFNLKAAASADGPGRVRIDYKVYQNGKLARPSAWNSIGGVLLGCSFTTSHVILPEKPVLPLTVGDEQIGWLVEAGGICGNTASLKFHVVLAPRNLEYAVTEFIAKQRPVTRKAEKIEIWYVYQEWGNAGTAASFFAPRRLVVDSSREFVREKLNPDFATWPKFENVNSFSSYFTAGLVDFNGAVMQSAVQTYFKDADSELYQEQGLPTTRALAETAAKSMSAIQDSLSAVVHGR